MKYWKDLSGNVHLEGAAAHPTIGTVTDGQTLNGGSGSVIFTLPEGYRPAEPYLTLPVITTPAASQDMTPGYIFIGGGGDGGVRFFEGNSQYVALDGIVFRAAS